MKHTISFLSFFALLLTFSCMKTTGQITSKRQLPLNLQNGLVAFYPFNGNAGDSSGNGNHGLPEGAQLTTDRFNNSNAAYAFSPSTSIILSRPIMALSGVRQFTISFWRRNPKGIAISAKIFDISGKYKIEIGQNYNPGKDTIWIADNSKYILDSIVIM